MACSRGVESLPTIKLYLRRIVCDKRIILQSGHSAEESPPFRADSLRKDVRVNEKHDMPINLI